MSDIDEKLEQILRALVFDNWHDDGYLPSYKKTIKQAFADAGYVKVILPSEPGYEIPKTFMTGQEWYLKFRKELDKAHYQLGFEYLSDVALDAAKHASGLE